ncbi:amino acid ABC transporter permease, partial [Ochrobactrum sp. MR34]|nr:amino acid ABC transporter permease [Ochrobactrum sp. MR34]
KEGVPMITVISEQFHNWLPQLLGGLRISLIVTGMSLLIGIPLGFFLSLGVMSKIKATRWAALTLVEVGRGAPSLVL